MTAYYCHLKALSTSVDIMNSGQDFGRWLQHQLDRRGWRQAEFARRVSASTGTVSHWITGSRLPSPDSCDRIADAFHIDVETVLRQAGHLPDPGTIDEYEAEIISLVRRIDWTSERVLMARGLLESMVKTTEAQRRMKAEGFDIDAYEAEERKARREMFPEEEE